MPSKPDIHVLGFLRFLATRQPLPQTREKFGRLMQLHKATLPQGNKCHKSGKMLFLMSQSGLLKVPKGTSAINWSQAAVGRHLSATEADGDNQEADNDDAVDDDLAVGDQAAEAADANAAADAAAEDNKDVVGSSPWTVVETDEQLKATVDMAMAGAGVIALDCEGVPDALHLVQLCWMQDSAEHVYLLDCVKIGADGVCAAIKQLLESPAVLKLVHDVHSDARALHRVGSILLKNVLDMQLLCEFIGDGMLTGFNKMLERANVPRHASKDSMHRHMSDSKDFWSKRPLAKESLEYAADDVRLLLQAYQNMTMQHEHHINTAIGATALRIAFALESLDTNRRQVAFSGNSHQMISFECAMTQGAGSPPHPIHCDESEVSPLLALLPLRICLEDADTRNLVDIQLDEGRPPAVTHLDNTRGQLSDEPITSEEIAQVIEGLGGPEAFGHDNRAGMEGLLHRISAMRNRRGDIYALTLRVGRAMEGNVHVITDLLLAPENASKSILILGEPGSGKTTIVREVARMLAVEHSVCIIDTSNEIAGDGNVPHRCVGNARRMMVQTLDDQGRVMVECVQNHTPHVMIVDEIGRKAEVEAAATVKQRGVRIIASAHGDFRSLNKNPQLRTLLGNLQHTIKPGGHAAVERISDPVFDIIIEVSRRDRNSFSIILDVGKAVDAHIERRTFRKQIRTRDPESGNVYLELQHADSASLGNLVVEQQRMNF